MTIYNFEAIENYPGAKIIDRYRLEAMTFAEACNIAQDNELNTAHEHDREATIYDEFKQIKND
jgi:hypothetical protein